jgi:membrane-associated phospholipid phosphatase
MDTTVRALGRRWRRPLALAGLGCLALVVLLGLAVGPRSSAPDRDLQRVLREPLDGRPYRRAVMILASESGWPHASRVLAVVPVAVAGGLVVADLARHRRIEPARWRWLPLVLAALPLQHLLRLTFDRAGPRLALEAQGQRGAYPSGAALAVALGWAVGMLVTVDLRPRWRWLAAAATAVALGLHGAARVAAHKHWATDILGSYLLAGGALLLVAALPSSERR